MKKTRWMRPFCLGAAVFLSSAALGEQGPRVVGPGGGGAMFHVTINPKDRNEVLLSCDMTGAYISHDGGHHWRMFSLRGSIHFFAFDPSQRHTLYAATDALWKSTDDGESWRLLWPRPSTVRAVVMDSDHADESYVAKPNPIGTITDLAIDPADSRTLYATASRQGRSAIVLSRDGGQSWQSLQPLNETPLRIWIDPRSARGDRDLYVATSAGIRVRTRGQWQQRDLPSGFTLAEVSAGFSAKDREGVFYAVATDKQSRRQLFLTTDAGVTWAPVQPPGSGAQVRAVATSLDHTETAYVSYKDLEIDGKRFQGVARTDDYGVHWRLVWRSSFQREAANVHDAWIAEAMTPEWTEEPLSLTVDDHDPNLAYVTDLGRTMETTDGGANWVASYSEPAKETAQSEASWISTGLDVTTTYGYEFDPFDPRHHFILTTDIGLFRSEDGGHSWMRSVKGAPPRWTNTTYSIAFDPKVRGKMWAAMSEIHDLPRPKMWRHRPTSEYVGGICFSMDGGKTWQAANKGMPETAPTSVVLDPTSPELKRTLWAATMGYGVFRSTDDGHTWFPANHGITQENPLAWRLVRAPDGTLYTLIARRSEDGSIGNSGDGALYRSTDGGENWIPVPLPTGANAPNGLAIDPENPNRLYLALWARATPEGEPIASPNQNPSRRSVPQLPVVLDGVAGGITVSSDGGRTWRWVLERDRHIYDVTIDPKDPRTLYASGFESSAWISHDRGEHWSCIPGFNFKWAHRVEADQEDSSKVYISTFGGGVWHIPIAGSSPKDIATPALAPTHSR